MASIRDRLMDAVQAALEQPSAGGTTKPSGLTVHRFRSLPIERDTLPSILFYPEDDTPEVRVVNRTDRTLVLRFELRATVAKNSYPDKAIDPLYVWLMKALFADESFGGLAAQVIEGGMQWQDEVADTKYAAAAVTVSIEYVTFETDPEQQ